MKIYPEFEKFFPGSYSNHWKLYFGIINRFLKKFEISPTFKNSFRQFNSLNMIQPITKDVTFQGRVIRC